MGALRGAKAFFLFVINMLRRIPTETRTPMSCFWLTIFGEATETSHHVALTEVIVVRCWP